MSAVAARAAAPAPRARGILFSAPMVRALLADQKTQTRRVITPQPSHEQRHEWKGKLVYEGEHRMWCWKQHAYDNLWDFGDRNEDRRRLAKLCPHGAVGDRLWVRETWNTFDPGTDCPAPIPPERWGKRAPWTGCEGDRPIEWTAVYRADGELEHPIDGAANWKPSIFMPRWASRITLEITDVRVQRLQDISAADACDEGATSVLYPQHPLHDECYAKRGTWTGDEKRDVDGPFAGAVDAFATLWDSINEDRAPWESNPFVWAISFRRLP